LSILAIQDSFAHSGRETRSACPVPGSGLRQAGVAPFLPGLRTIPRPEPVLFGSRRGFPARRTAPRCKTRWSAQVRQRAAAFEHVVWLAARRPRHDRDGAADNPADRAGRGLCAGPACLHGRYNPGAAKRVTAREESTAGTVAHVTKTT
jgi:hypothetical protein